MAYLVTADAIFAAETYRQVGTATVWDVRKETDQNPSGILVGRIVQRDGQMYARDNTACGEPVYLPDGFAGLYSMLYYAHGVLFDTLPA